MYKHNVDYQLKHLFDGGDLNVYESNVLNLGVGAPGSDLLQNCCEIFKKATEHRMKEELNNNLSLLFQYGPTSGSFGIRSAISNYFTKMYNNEVKSEDLIITTGASQGLHFILSTLLDFNGFVFIDDVTYMIALDIFRQFDTLNIIPIRLRDDGVDLKLFETVLKAKKFRSNTKEFWGIYYTIPIFHNPTGIMFSDYVCKCLIKLARKYDFLIICDDVYNILDFDDAVPPKRLFSYDDRNHEDYLGNVISNGSFSKIIGPGIRVGWLEVPARLKTKLDNSGIIRSGGCFNNYTAGILASLFELNLAQTHITTMYEVYKERMLATCKILEQYLPLECSMISPKGGYFIWIRLPERIDSRDFLKFCLIEEKIIFLPGPTFTFTETAKNCLRLSIAFHNKDKLVDGATRLCSAIRKFIYK